MKQNTSISTLSGLALARYVLNRLVDQGDSIERLAEDFDNDEQFILGVVDFLINIGWIKQTESGVYKITKKGQTNIIEREKVIPNFTVYLR
jgi:predicted transcriptional regulator